MPVVAFPPEVMSSLLSSLDTPTSQRSPFAFVQKNWIPVPLTAYEDWLKDKELLTDSSVLQTSWKNALQMAAQPSHNLAIVEKSGDDDAILSHLLDGRSLIVATIDEQSCLLSTSISVEDFVRGVLLRLPVTEEEKKPPRPWMTEHQVLLLMGALVNEGLGTAPEHLRRKVLFASMPRSLRELPGAQATEKLQASGLDVEKAEEIMELIVGDESLAKALVMDLIVDNILMVEDEQCFLHPFVEPWAAAIADGSHLEWILTTLGTKDSKAVSSEEQRLLFFGKGERGCVAFPASEDGFVVFARPHSKDMFSLLLSFLRGAQATTSLAGFGGGIIRG